MYDTIFLVIEMNCKYAAFDMDGTLLDTMDYWRNIVEYYAKMTNLPKPSFSQEDIDIASHRPTHLQIEYLKERYSDETVKRITAEDVYDVLEYCYKSESRVRHGVIEMLDVLKQNGVRMCVVSATPSYLIEIALKNAGIFDYFEFVLSPTEYPKGKQDPAIFFGAANRFGCEVNEIALFEDMLYSIKTAHSIGMYIVAVKEKYAEHFSDEIKLLSNEYYDEFTEFKTN